MIALAENSPGLMEISHRRNTFFWNCKWSNYKVAFPPRSPTSSNGVPHLEADRPLFCKSSPPWCLTQPRQTPSLSALISTTVSRQISCSFSSILRRLVRCSHEFLHLSHRVPICIRLAINKSKVGGFTLLAALLRAFVFSIEYPEKPLTPREGTCVPLLAARFIFFDLAVGTLSVSRILSFINTLDNYSIV